MQIKLINLNISNFKGVESFNANFNGITNIFGANGTGKTTLLDAFLWLFFGKNSEDAAKFEIKRLNSNNNFIKDIEANVSATINVNGKEIVVRKSLRQKWTSRRGSAEKEYTGDENKYFWNDAPITETEFKSKMAPIINESLFKLITNPFYFNSMKWQDRRNSLIDLAGNISNEEVFDSIITVNNKGDFQALINAINQDKSIDEFKREISSKKKIAKDELETIPNRIDEVNRAMPQTQDFEAIRTAIRENQSSLNAVQTQMDNQVVAQKEELDKQKDILSKHHNEKQEHQNKIFEVKGKISNIEFDAKSSARDLAGNIESEISTLSRQISDKESEIKKYELAIDGFRNEITEKELNADAKRKDWYEEDAKKLEFSDTLFNCPSCKQSLPEGDIETKKSELTTNFNNEKREKLAFIERVGQSIKGDIAALYERIQKGTEAIDSIKKELLPIQEKLNAKRAESSSTKKSVEEIVLEILNANANYQTLKADLNILENKTFVEPTFPPTNIDEELRNKRNAIQNEINQLESSLHTEQQIQRNTDRIKELRIQEETLVQTISQLEGAEFSILQFTKAKVEMLENKLNGKFKFVKFKMFTTQVNGGESECCETLINGVPFPDANNAAKINAGIDIINALCKHNDVYAPIFIDNRESVSELIDSDSQIVNLFVSAPDKKLRVA